MRTKNVYVLMLALVIVLSGCFGNTADDADGQQTTNSNVAPLIEIGDWSTEDGDHNASHWNLTIYRAMTDIDGTISSAGWDFDLDGTIDVTSTSVRSIDQLSIPASNWLNYSTIAGSASTAKITTISFIAIDDDGDSSGELVTINTETSPYWAGSTRNSYTAVDADASVTAGDDDTLMRISWQHAEDDLNWAFVVMKLTVGDMSYDCSTGADDDCQITQDGSDVALWEKGEFLTLAENGANIAEGTEEISMYVTYKGTAVAGSSTVTVA